MSFVITKCWEDPSETDRDSLHPERLMYLFRSVPMFRACTRPSSAFAKISRNSGLHASERFALLQLLPILGAVGLI